MSSLLLSQRQLSILWTMEIYCILFYLYISRNCFKTLRMALAAHWWGLVPWKENSSQCQAAQNKLRGLPWVTRSGFLENWRLGVIRAKGGPISLVNVIKRQRLAPKTIQVETSPPGQISRDVPPHTEWSFTLTVVEMLPESTGAQRGAAYPRSLHNGSVEGLYLHGTDGDSDISTWLR